LLPHDPFIMNECLEGMKVCGGSFINNLLIGANIKAYVSEI